MSEFEERKKVPEALVADLLQNKGSKTGPLIQDLSATEPASAPLAAAHTSQEEEPTMLEMMMAAQRKAREEQGKLKETELKTAANTGFSGFKKGFFGGSGANKVVSKSTPTAANKSSAAAPASSSDIIEVKAAPSTKGADIKAAAKTNPGVLLPEVQSALEAEKHPLLKQLESKDWVNDSLMDKIQQNLILRTGMSHPKCMAAMQLMQSNPKEAMERFKDDAEVTRFLQEFGKVMAEHFESLGKQQEVKNGPAGAESVVPSDNVGPLQAEALKKHANVPKSKIEEVDPEQAKVNAILQDPELRDILMDPGMQRVLMECGDPAKFRAHMQNKETARKLFKLKQAGLVQVEM